MNGLAQYGNLLNPSGQRAVSDFDRTHRFVVSYNYDLPVAKLLRGHGSTRVVKRWTFNGVSTFQSGTPITVFDGSTFTLQDLDGINRAQFATLAAGATPASALTSGN